MSLNIKNKNSSVRPSINKAPEGMTGPGYEHSSPIYANIRVAAGFLLMTLGTAAMYIGMVGLKPVALEFGITRSLGALPYALFMVGYGAGGIIFGRFADKFGIIIPLLIGSLCAPLGIYLAGISEYFWQYVLSLSILSGLLGSSVTFSPIVSDISHWFTARRGLALSIVISGSYFSGAIWPPIIQTMFDTYEWRIALQWIALISLCSMIPLSLMFWRRPVHLNKLNSDHMEKRFSKPLGFSPQTLQFAVCCAGIGCCIAMSMPQAHIVSYATDLGFIAQRGAEMLSLMFGFGIISRLASGFICDKIGGLKTVLFGSSLQCCAIVAFLGVDSLTGLYIISACFGLSQGGIVPSYAVIIRTYFPPHEAGWRIGLALFSTIIGMAIGAWVAGKLFDITGSYTLSFVNALVFNMINLFIVGILVGRARRLDSGVQQ